jgi:hypothetical protein
MLVSITGKSFKKMNEKNWFPILLKSSEDIKTTKPQSNQ